MDQAIVAPLVAAGVVPPAAALDGSTGTSADYARADHTHAVKVQRTVVTTDAKGNASWTFARPFAALPAITALANTTGQPIAISIAAKTTTSVTINARLSQTLPAVLASLSPLMGFNLFANPAAGVQIDLYAAEVTQ